MQQHDFFSFVLIVSPPEHKDTNTDQHASGGVIGVLTDCGTNATPDEETNEGHTGFESCENEAGAKPLIRSETGDPKSTRKGEGIETQWDNESRNSQDMNHGP